jgi:regulator of protease activity HflC (stomatin/prohibitin superfamily)
MGVALITGVLGSLIVSGLGLPGWAPLPTLVALPLAFRAARRRGVEIFSIACWDAIVSVFIGNILGERLVPPPLAVLPRVVSIALVALAVSTLVLAVLLVLVVYVSSQWVLSMHRVYNVRRTQALTLVAFLITGVQYPYLIVEKGEILKTQPEGVLDRIGGPGIVVVKPYQAVVFEQSGNITRIVGPGLHLMQRFERIHAIVDLRPQWGSFCAENVLTRDKVPLMIEAGVGYRIETLDVVRRRESRAERAARSWREEKGDSVVFSASGGKLRGPDPEKDEVLSDSVFKAVFWVVEAGWQKTTAAAAESALRKAVGRCNFADIYQLSESGEFEQREPVVEEIMDTTTGFTQDAAAEWGVYVSGVLLKTIEIPEEVKLVKERYFNLWGAEWQKQIKIAAAEGDAEASRLAELARAKAQLDMILAMAESVDQAGRSGTEVDPGNFIALRFIEALEKIAAEAGTQVFLGDEILSRIGRMKRAVVTGSQYLLPQSDAET